MRLLRLSIIALLLWPIINLQAQPAAPSPVATSQPIPRQQLVDMFKRELGDLFRQDQIENYLASHRAIEQYFAADAEKRKAIVGAIEVAGVDPNILGRLARIREEWPELTPGGVYYINERLGPMDVHYFLGIPKTYDRTHSWPLVVKLPTADAFVGNPKPTADDVQRIYTNWMSEELAHHPDGLLIMPLLNLDDLWGPSYAGMNSVIGPILHVGDRANVDPSRVYLVGHSMSGHAAWNLPLHYPTYFTASNPLAGNATGDWQRLRAMNLRNLYFVAWHDSDDQVIKINSTRTLVGLLKRFKVDIDFIETKGIGHVPTQAIVDQCYDKLMAHKRVLYPKQVSLQSNRPETIFNRVDWLQVYQAINPGEEKKTFFQRKPGYMVLNAHTWNAQATLADNRFDITTDNVALMRLYVNEQMIDFGKPVTVTVNRKVRFEGMVTPSVDVMLKDQIFLGRGMRYFTGVIDLDLAAGTASRPTTAK